MNMERVLWGVTGAPAWVARCQQRVAAAPDHIVGAWIIVGTLTVELAVVWAVLA